MKKFNVGDSVCFFIQENHKLMDFFGTIIAEYESGYYEVSTDKGCFTKHESSLVRC